MSFFVTSYQQIQDLSGSPDGFGGDLRYNGAPTGLEGADAICQEMARRVCFGFRGFLGSGRSGVPASGGSTFTAFEPTNSEHRNQDSGTLERRNPGTPEPWNPGTSTNQK